VTDQTWCRVQFHKVGLEQGEGKLRSERERRYL
jgi:hypothetical protein